MGVHLCLHIFRDASHTLLILEAEMDHGNIYMLMSEYLGANINQIKVAVELPNHLKKINNTNPILPQN